MGNIFFCLRELPIFDADLSLLDDMVFKLDIVHERPALLKLLPDSIDNGLPLSLISVKI